MMTIQDGSVRPGFERFFVSGLEGQNQFIAGKMPEIVQFGLNE